jgi:hypothetical protein
VYDSITVEQESVGLNSTIGIQNILNAGTPDDGGEIVVQSEIEVEVEKAASANSSFSEATDEGEVDEYEHDVEDKDEDEIMDIENEE